MTTPISEPKIQENVELWDLTKLTVLPASHFRKPEDSAFSAPCDPCAHGSGHPHIPKMPTKPFIALHRDFLKLLGPDPTLKVLCEDKEGRALFHEAGVWVKETEQVFFTSNLMKQEVKFTDSGLASGLSRLSTVSLPTSLGAITEPQGWQDLPASTSFPSSNGACLYTGQILVCDQGHGTSQPSQLVLVDPSPPHTATPLLNNYHGRPFNSLNDVIPLPTPGSVDEHQTIWFTDPTYGYEQEFKPAPELPSQVYCFDPSTGNVRAVADGFVKPNGIAFNMEGTVCYVTDTGMISGNGVIDGNKPGTIYAFDVIYPPLDVHPSVAGPTLHNRRVFAFVDSGAPDGIKLDQLGNVYAGCFDGIHVWNSYGMLLGKILFARDENDKDVCANFCFVPGGRMVCMAEDRMYIVEGLAVEGALKH